MNVLNRESSASGYEVRFRSLFHEGRALAFLCDDKGQVQIDNLTEQGRHNYLFARAMVGRDFAPPEVRPTSSTSPK